MLEQYELLIKIRRRVFEEVAKLAYDEEDYHRLAELPYEILQESVGRSSIFLERAIVRERLRLAIGLPVRKANEQGAVFQGIEEALKDEKFYEPPLINVIDFACDGCPEESYYVTDVCQGWPYSFR